MAMKVKFDSNCKEPDYKDPAKFAAACEKYFQELDDTKRPTVAGLALACGFNARGTMWHYRKKEGYKQILDRAMLVIEEWLEQNIAEKTDDLTIFSVNRRKRTCIACAL